MEKILEFRDFEKKQAEAELAKALSVETEIQNSLNAIASQFASLKNYMKGSLDFSDMVSMSQNTSLLNFQKEELLKQLSQAKIVSEQKRDVLRECMKKTNALEKMKELSAILSEGFPHVRVDLYEINGKVYFGELTFYHFGGVEPFIPEEWDTIFGSWIQLPERGVK